MGDGYDDVKDPQPLIATYYNYFIYYERPTGEEKSSMKEPAYWMAEYAYDNEDCIMYPVSFMDDFIKVWNYQIPNYAPNIHVYLHGGIDTLEFYNESIDGEDIDDGIYELTNKTVLNKVYLYSCEGGTVYHFDSPYEEYSAHQSIAMCFAKLCVGTSVIALENDEVDYFRLTKYTPSNMVWNGFLAQCK